MRTSVVDVYAVVRAIDHVMERGYTAQMYIDMLHDEYGIVEGPGGFKIINEQKYTLFLLRWSQ